MSLSSPILSCSILVLFPVFLYCTIIIVSMAPMAVVIAVRDGTKNISVILNRTRKNIQHIQYIKRIQCKNKNDFKQLTY